MKVRLLCSAVLHLPLIAVLASLAYGQCEASSSPSGEPREFGRSVATDGQRALVGGPLSGGPSTAGAVYAFERAGSAWTETQVLLAPDAESFDNLGWSVAIDGDSAVVGAARGPSFPPGHRGKAYASEHRAGAWTDLLPLVAIDTMPGDAYGLSVDVSADSLVVGAPGHDPLGIVNAGAAYVFERVGTSWGAPAKLTAADWQPFDEFGHAVAIDGAMLAIGAHEEDHDGVPNAGAVYVFERIRTRWEQVAKLVAPDPDPHGLFGASVALSGDTLLAGSPLDDHSNAVAPGSAYVFERSGDVWSHVRKLVAHDLATHDRFGISCAVDGSRALVGAWWAGIGPNADSGAVYVFERSGTTWIESRKLVSAEHASVDGFGASVDLSGDHAIVGAPHSPPESLTPPGFATTFDLASCVVGTRYCSCDASSPCGNVAAGSGCANSTGVGAVLEVWGGSTSVADDVLILGVRGAVPFQPGVFLQGDDAAALPFGDGLRCAVGNVLRLEVAFASEAGGVASTLAITTLGGVAAGDLKRYQFWYRDPAGSPCGSGFNLTSAVEITWGS